MFWNSSDSLFSCLQTFFWHKWASLQTTWGKLEKVCFFFIYRLMFINFKVDL